MKSLEELKKHILYLIERDNSEINEEVFERELKYLLKYVSELMKDQAH